MRRLTRRRRARAPDPAAPIGDEEAANLFSLWNSLPGVLLAVSGGPDSIALLGLAARWRAGGAPGRLLSATFDHGLRPESVREARAVADFAERLGIRHHILGWAGGKPATAIQEQARAARYDALARLALFNEASHVALAHHRGDQAETVLMRLAAGTGVAGLRGMGKLSPRGAVILHRPFLDIPKERLIATCRAHGWLYFSDPSNEDHRFARARWRKVAPSLAAEGLTSDRLAALAVRARRADAALEGVVDSWLERHPPKQAGPALALDGAPWRAEAEEIRLRILGRLIGRVIAAAGLDAAPERLERLERLEQDMAEALDEGRAAARNLRGVVVRVSRRGALTLAPEPPRRRTARSS